MGTSVLLQQSSRSVMMKVVLLLWLFSSVPTDGKSTDVLDLSHELNNQTIHWPTVVPFQLTINNRGLKNPDIPESDSNFWYELNQFTTSEHGGTHLDAPVHFSRGAWSVDEIPPNRFIAPVSIIDLRQTVKGDADYLITSDDLKKWEADTGNVLSPLIILWTGWASRWNNRTSYFGTNSSDTTQLRFPGLHPDGARWLVDNRKIFGIGIDTLSIDSGRSSADLRAHRILAPHNIFNLENLNTKPLESRSEQFKNPFLVVSPLKISGGSGSPVRPFIIDTPNYLINDVRRTTSPLSYILLLLLNFVTFLSMGL